MMALGFALGFLVRHYSGRSADGLLGVPDEEANEIRAEGRAAVQTRTKRRYARIVERTKKLGQITNDNVEDLFCIGNSTASRYLGTLEKQGVLKQEGAGRGTFYTLSDTTE